jgi:hypothetical protein
MTRLYEAYGPHDPKFQQQNVCSFGIFGYQKTFWYYLARWLVKKIIRIKIFNQTKLFSQFLSNRNFKVSVEGEMSVPGEIHVGLPQGSTLSPTLHSLYKWSPQAPCVYLALFTADLRAEVAWPAAPHLRQYATYAAFSEALRKYTDTEKQRYLWGLAMNIWKSIEYSRGWWKQLVERQVL